MRVFQYRVAVLSACLPIAVAISGCSQPPVQPATPATSAPAAAPAQTPAERGKVLVTVGGCHDCHSPKKIGPGGPEPDMSRALSGHREDVKVTAGFKTPKGGPLCDSYDRRPDRVERRVGRLVRGKSHAGSGYGNEHARTVVPGRYEVRGAPGQLTADPAADAMADVRNAQCDDLKAIYAYFKTLAPVKNKVPDPVGPAGNGMNGCI